MAFSREKRNLCPSSLDQRVGCEGSSVDDQTEFARASFSFFEDIIDSGKYSQLRVIMIC